LTPRGQAVIIARTGMDVVRSRVVTASADGVVTEVRVAPGQQVDAGLVLVVIAAREEGSAHAR
jgi:acetyl/propionyl-CoA carboxylase alpha subunit